MRERTHGHVGIDQSESGEHDARWAVRPVRRVGSGPRPVRPAAPVPYARPDAAPRPIPVRVGQGPEPGASEQPAGERASGVARTRACARGADGALRAPSGVAAGPRVLVRHPRVSTPRRRERVRRFLAAVAVALAAAGVVVGLGHLADYTAQARSHTPPVVVDGAP